MGTNQAGAHASLKATLVGGIAQQGTVSGISAAAATLHASALHETLIGPEEGEQSPASAVNSLRATTSGRTTVLPRRTKSESEATESPRFVHLRELGQGAMGQVDLARDNDIRRTVAVKRLLGEATNDAALLRFADEVRIVGQLEHPGIVPIYDVGRGDDGNVYLVMKHLQGETMESVIEKLRSGDAAYVERFTVEHRVHLFLGVLDAIRYAHSRGILHRDLKPANIMVGPFGEVTVLDWGIAKPIAKGSEQGSQAASLERTFVDSHADRLLETQFGSLAGTPLYMSPEQAAGRNDDLDERSDVYALSVILYEWLALEHPMRGVNTVTELLAAIIAQDYRESELYARAAQRGVPAEWVYVVSRGLARHRDKRIQSVEAFIGEVRNVLEGHIRIQCHITFAKRAAQTCARWVDKHPALYSALFGFVALSLLGGIGFGIWKLVGG